MLKVLEERKRLYRLTMLTIQAYQDFTETTDRYPKDVNLECYVMGLCSEAGEVADKIKKLYRDTDFTGQLDATQALTVAYELGDTLYYLARIADRIGWDLQDVMELNVDKLEDRKARDMLSGSGDSR